jgi:Flp pilus assembly protein TadB
MSLKSSFSQTNKGSPQKSLKKKPILLLLLLLLVVVVVVVLWYLASVYISVVVFVGLVCLFRYLKTAHW